MGERTGQTAMVIGGTGALGSGICRQLASEGADIAFTYNRNADAAAALARDIAAAGRRSFSHAVALDDNKAVQGFVADAVAELGRLDTLVYAAGPAVGLKPISKVDPAEWAQVMNADADGCFYLMHAALPHLRASKGTVVAVITCAVNRSTPLDILSVAPKATVQALVRGIAIEEGRNGIRANCIAPGFIEGGIGRDMLDSLGPEKSAALFKTVPLRRIGTVQEIADVASFLSSPRSSYVTGNTLFVSGGMEL